MKYIDNPRVFFFSQIYANYSMIFHSFLQICYPQKNDFFLAKQYIWKWSNHCLSIFDVNWCGFDDKFGSTHSIKTQYIKLAAFAVTILNLVLIYMFTEFLSDSPYCFWRWRKREKLRAQAQRKLEWDIQRKLKGSQL